MYKLGKTQTLIIKRITSIGAFLGETIDSDDKDDVLIPKKYLRKNKEVGHSLEVFIYKDNQNRPIATSKKPKAEVGDLAILQVVDTTKIGAFLDWGLDKDLLLPFEEQVGQIKKYDYHLVGVYIDKSDRLTATMKVDDYFANDGKMKEDDWVDGIIYAYDSSYGAFILVEGKYNGMLHQDEITGVPKVGDSIRLRVKKVKEDGKLDLTYNNRAHVELNKDANLIYKTLSDNGGYLKVNDKSDPKLIRSVFNMSKSQFKRSIGRLYKQRKINITKDGIKLLK
ncbi:S1-like domain-containing RNA-binding protein [uncultured Helcococcus sp.]|uniref:CvfB family protein n=1 Tax=uncultured Helcococcus sp. TaxID=1072508 RepID=UPI00288A25D2|nr:S1-like domain-containing RNA-binding protein [uncultured Helcococcus sp.]